jgi:hypothetical protein
VLIFRRRRFQTLQLFSCGVLFTTSLIVAGGSYPFSQHSREPCMDF